MHIALFLLVVFGEYSVPRVRVCASYVQSGRIICSKTRESQVVIESSSSSQETFECYTSLLLFDIPVIYE